MKPLFILTMLATMANAGTLYLPAYPASVLVIDESNFQILDRIPLVTGTPTSMRLSPDHKTLYVTTIDHNGFETIDLATRKVTNHFVLNTPTKQYRFRGGAVDPQGKSSTPSAKRLINFKIISKWRRRNTRPLI